MNTVEILQEAKNILMEGPWGKALGGVSAPTEGRCALTAIAAAEFRARVYRTNWGRDATNYLGRAAMDRGFMGAHLFNDHPDTTFNDVMELFDEAIIRAKEDENV